MTAFDPFEMRWASSIRKFTCLGSPSQQTQISWERGSTRGLAGDGHLSGELTAQIKTVVHWDLPAAGSTAAELHQFQLATGLFGSCHHHLVEQTCHVDNSQMFLSNVVSHHRPAHNQSIPLNHKQILHLIVMMLLQFYLRSCFFIYNTNYNVQYSGRIHKYISYHNQDKEITSFVSDYFLV